MVRHLGRAQIALSTAVLLAAGLVSTGQGAVLPPVTDGLVLGYDGSSLTHTGGFVDSWHDQALDGGTHNATATGNNRPLLDTVNTLNGHYVLKFDGLASTTDGDLLTTTFTPNAGVSMFVVVRSVEQNNDTGSSLRPIVAANTPERTGIYVIRGTSFGSVGFRYNDQPNNVNPNVIGDGQYHVATGVGQTGTNGVGLYVDAILRATGTTAADPTFGPVQIGGQSGSAPRRFAGSIAEVLVYDRALDAAERYQVEAYLMGKYGLPLIDERWTTASFPPDNSPLSPSRLSDPRAEIAWDGTGGGPFLSNGGAYVYTGEAPTGTSKWAFTLKTATAGAIDFTQGTTDLQFTVNNTSPGEFQVLLSNLPGARYAVSGQKFTAAGWPTITLDLDAMTWYAFDPNTKTQGGPVTPDFSSIWEVGFASLITTSAERIDNIRVFGTHLPGAYSGPVAQTLATEPWATWNGTAPGRQQNEPLNGAVHLTNPALAVGLNETNGRPFVSASGYVFTGEQATWTWAFTLKPSLPAMYIDFTYGSQDLTFDQRNDGGGEFRILIAGATGGGYAVSDMVFNYQHASVWNTVTVDLDAMTWSAFDPATRTIGDPVTPDFRHIVELGFASVVNVGTERIDNLVIRGLALVPEPAALWLMGAGLAPVLALARRRRERRLPTT